jgi:hypothetical protein
MWPSTHAPEPARPGAAVVILLHPEAPPKPAEGRACNGCGACCAWQPCPLGQWLSRRRTGTCAALAWDAASRRYVCGALADPRRWLPWLPAAVGRALAQRWIAAGAGCDAGFDTEA